MPGFADSFWSADYAAGIAVLFNKLQQGVVENDQVLTVARMRADAEEQYSKRLAEIGPATEKLSNGFQRDDGASLKKAYEGVRTEMAESSKKHAKISSSINELVVEPFSRWCDSHENRVLSCHEDLQNRIRVHDRQAELVRKLRSAYFNKCRQVEDMEEESKLGFQDPDKVETSPKGKAPTIKLPEEQSDEPDPIDLGDEMYSPERLKELLADMLGKIPVGETKVSFLGTYQNVSTGSDIVDYMQKNMSASSVSYAERIGQDMVANGLLRLVGNVGNTFANSSRMNYQWRPLVFVLTGIPEKRQKLQRTGTTSSELLDSPVSSVGDMLQGWNPLNNTYPGETPGDRLRREARDADEKYKAAVRKLDSLRCNLEEAIVERLKFMEQCELDRLKALKAVMLDFSGAMGNVIPSLQSTVDNMMLYQEAVHPQGDLRYLLENYKTGSFVPKVQTYDNYYNNVDGQTFGVDLEARARQDRKRVPILVTSILTFLDNHYPDLEGDEVRRNIWTVDVPLAATHHLRSQINNGEPPPRDILERYEIPIVASVLKLYLLELPDSLVSSQTYEVIKTIYSSPESSGSDEARVSVLQNTLGQLRLANIATLDAITTHFTRLIELTSADEAYVANLAQILAPCVLRPRVENTLTMHERHPYRLIRDLFDHKEEIFGELKRASSQNAGPNKTPNRTSGGVTDESNRRANMEARTKAIMSRSRAASPAPVHVASANAIAGVGVGSSPSPVVNLSANRHRRERSVGDPHMRFPVVASPTVGDNVHRRGRPSLEVPDGPASTASTDPPNPESLAASLTSAFSTRPRAATGSNNAATSNNTTNGSSSMEISTATAASSTPLTSATMHSPPAAEESAPMHFTAAEEEVASPVSTTSSMEKKNSITRSSFANRVHRKAAASASGQSFQIGKIGSVTGGRNGRRESHGSMTDAAKDGRDSVVTIPESHSEAFATAAAVGHHGGAHGVELSDRPMDF